MQHGICFHDTFARTFGSFGIQWCLNGLFFDRQSDTRCRPQRVFNIAKRLHFLVLYISARSFGFDSIPSCHKTSLSTMFKYYMISLGNRQARHFSYHLSFLFYFSLFWWFVFTIDLFLTMFFCYELLVPSVCLSLKVFRVSRAVSSIKHVSTSLQQLPLICSKDCVFCPL